MATMELQRTPAEELAAAGEALRAARAEFRNWAAHCDRMLADPEDAAAIAWQARRSALIVQALLDEAEVCTMAARG